MVRESQPTVLGFGRMARKKVLTSHKEEVMAEDKTKYTKPDLRERIKNRVMREGRGGKPGEWS